MPDSIGYAMPMPGRGMDAEQSATAKALWAEARAVIDSRACGVLRQLLRDEAARADSRLLGAQTSEDAAKCRNVAHALGFIDRLLTYWGSLATEADKPPVPRATTAFSDENSASQALQLGLAADQMAQLPGWAAICAWHAGAVFALADIVRVLPPEAVAQVNELRRHLEAIPQVVRNWISAGTDAGGWLRERSEEGKE